MSVRPLLRQHLIHSTHHDGANPRTRERLLAGCRALDALEIVGAKANADLIADTACRLVCKRFDLHSAQNLLCALDCRLPNPYRPKHAVTGGSVGNTIEVTRLESDAERRFTDGDHAVLWFPRALGSFSHARRV
jgi:hypothetical protein